MKTLLGFFIFSGIVFGQTTLFENGKILSAYEKNGEWASQLLVKDGRVVEVGKSLSVPDGTTRVDLHGRYILPSLTDAHAHLLGIGREGFEVDLKGSATPEEAAERVKKFIQEKHISPGTAVFGRGWDQSEWPGKEFSNRLVLDVVSPKHPVVLYRVDGHAAWVNTLALKGSKIWKAKEDPKGGKIVFDKRHVPTGILIDNAMDPLDELRKSFTEKEFNTYVRRAVEQAWSLGITGIHDAGIDPKQIIWLQKQIKNENLGFRFYEMLSSSNSKTLKDALKKGPLVGTLEGRLTVRGVKFFLDGAMGSRGAAFDEPYSDDPANSGLLLTDPADFERTVREASAAGFQVAVHAIGSKANRIALDTFEKVWGDKSPIQRPRLEHAQVLTLKDIERLKKLGAIASMQPVHCTSDMKWVYDRIGKDRARYSYAWRSVLDHGGVLAFGSDAPVESLNPWPGLFAAITRQNESLQPEGGFNPEEKITLAEAFKGFSEGAAYAGFQESELGSLTTGKWADFIALEKNPFDLKPLEIAQVKVVQTYVAGNKVWERQALP